jgi:ATP/ADP translocase/HEAT repeat protein
LLGRIRQVLKIQASEGQKVLLATLYLFFAVSAFITGRICRDTLFLEKFDQGTLAFMYVTVALIVPIGAYFYGRIADRYRRDRIILFTLILMIFSLGAIYAMLRVRVNEPLLIFLYNFIELMGAFLMIQFWTFAGDIFTTREAKRVFPVVGAGGVLAGIFGVRLARFFLDSFPVSNLLLLMILFLIIDIGIIIVIGVREHARLQEAIVGRSSRTDTKTFHIKREIQDLFRNKHLKLIAGMTVVTFFCVPLVDYQFKVFAKQHYTVDGVVDKLALASFFADFYFATGIIAAIAVLLTSRILERFGVVVALLVLPLSLLICIAGILLGVANIIPFALTFSATLLAKGAENSFRYSIYDATMQVIYTPVATHLRVRAKTIIDGVLKPWSTGLSGLLMVFVVKVLGLTVSYLAGMACLLTLCWVILVSRIRKEYVGQLLATLRQRRLDFSDNTLRIADEKTIEVLRGALRSHKASEVNNAIDLVLRVEGFDLSDEIVVLLTRQEAELRVRALDVLGQRGTNQHTELIQKCFEDENDLVRAAALRAFCAIVGEPALRVVQGFLSSDVPEIQGAAVTSLIRHGGLEGILISAEHLKKMQQSEDESFRFSAARVFQEIAVRNFYQPVLKLMHDSSVRVQNAAVDAAGVMQSPELIPAVIYKLGHRETARSASTALVLFGDEVVPTLGKVLTHSAEDAFIRRQIPRILERIGSKDCLSILLEALDTEESESRLEVIRAVARLSERLDLRVDETTIRNLLDQEIKQYYQLVATKASFADLDPTDGLVLLRDAIEERLNKARDRFFLLLGVIYPPKAIELIYSNLKSSNLTIRSNAIEVLDNLLDKDLKRKLIPIVEKVQKERMLSVASEFFDLRSISPEDWMREFLESKETWLVVVTINVVGEMKLISEQDTIVRHLRNRNPIIRETALHTLARMVPPADLEPYCELLSNDVDDLVRQYATELKSLAA